MQTRDASESFSRDSIQPAQLLGALRCAPYWCIVRGFSVDPAVARHQVTTLCLTLGSLRRQNLDGDVVSEVRAGGKGPQVGARTTNALLWHTDTIFDREAPEVVALCVARAGVTGGASCIVTVDAMLSELNSRNPSAIDRLVQPFWFSRADYATDNEPSVVSAPVLTIGADEGRRVLYNRARIQRGYRLAGVEQSEADRAALHALDVALESPDTERAETVVPVGSTLFFNNHKVLHNRTAFSQDAGNERLLFRVWVEPSSMAPSIMGPNNG